MQALIAELTAGHASEASLLGELLREDPGDDELRERIAAHLDGLLVGLAHGIDPLAGLDAPWRGADLFPAAWLARMRPDLGMVVQADADDEDGAVAITAALGFPGTAGHWPAREKPPIAPCGPVARGPRGEPA